MIQHTPQPWRFEDGMQGAFIRGPEGFVIARLYIPSPDVWDPKILDLMAANGALMAAAPELAAALTQLVAVINAPPSLEYHLRVLAMGAALNAANKAIAKAQPEGVR